MSHRTISIFFLLALAGAVAVFSQRPPRAQAQLAAAEDAIRQALHGQKASRIYFGPAGDEDAFVWYRYFAAPALLVDSEPYAGDTVLWVNEDDMTSTLDSSMGTVLANARSGTARAVLYIIR